MKPFAFALGQPHALAQGVRLMPIEIILKQEGAVTPEQLFLYEEVQDLGDGLYRRAFRLVNYADTTFQAQLVLPLETGFAADHWLIPGVMYNGNPFGDKDSPKGLTRDGQPWVFAYDHSTLPACTLTENAENVAALFASDRDASSLTTSCSLKKNPDGSFRQEIIYPIVEEPVSYSGKNKVSPAIETWLTFEPGTAFEAESYAFVGVPPYPNYGFLPLMERAMPLFRNEILPSMDEAMVRRLALTNLRLGVEIGREKGQIGLQARDYTHPIGNDQTGGPWDGLTLQQLEADPSLNRLMVLSERTGMGFSNQGFMQCRMLMEEAIRTGDEDTFRYLDDFLTRWISHQQPNGLCPVAYPLTRKGATLPDGSLNPKHTGDLTHMGWGAGEAVQLYHMLKTYGRDGEKYLTFARRLCDFFVEHYNDQRLFGQVWTMDGECVAESGCGGGFMVKAMAELYEETRENKYLEAARRALRGYSRTNLDQFVCTAGAIDCVSVDKESAFPFLAAAIILYQCTGEEEFLIAARKAGAYFLSWMFMYEPLYDDPACDFRRLGYKASGGTVVSTEHQCQDPYAVVIPAHLIALSKADHNDIWRKAAVMIWRNGLQCVAGPEGMTLHGLKRAPGMHNEAFCQARWTKYRAKPAETRGHLNDYMGMWLNCFKLYNLDRLERDGYGEGL